jgi:hypothetical protein
VTITLQLPSIGAIGFIDMQAHVLNAFATAVSNDNNPYCQGWAAAEFQIGLITAIHRAIPRPNMM